MARAISSVKISEFTESCASDLKWRLTELSDLKLFARDAGEAQRLILRSGLLLLYAHWEGYIKTATSKFLGVVGSHRVRFGQIRTALWVDALRSELDRASSRTLNFNERISLIDAILAKSSQYVTAYSREAINTEANLNVKVLRRICDLTGLDHNRYIRFSDVIDRRLLGERNKIAHGEFVEMSIAEYEDVSRQILDLMSLFTSDLEDALALRSWQR